MTLTNSKKVIQAVCSRATVIEFPGEAGALWSLPLADQSDPIVVLWTDSLPWVDQVPLGHILTPLDWSVAAALRGNTLPFTLVLDTRSTDVPYREAKGIELFQTLRFEGAHHLTLRTLAAFWQLLGSAKTWRLDEGQRYLAKAAWRARLFDSADGSKERHDHHALSNVVVPTLMGLAREVADPDGIGAKQIQWLRLLLESVGVPPVSPVADPAGAPGKTDPKFPKLALLDDHSRHGWSSLVSKVSGVAPTSFTSVQHFFADDVWGTGGVGRLRCDADVLFLDLRLLPDGDLEGQVTETKEALRNGFGIFEPGKHLQELDRPFRLRGPDASSTDDELLAFLPGVIADLDPTLPVILFSSASRRETMDPLREVPTIVTDFQKPLLTPAGLVPDRETATVRLSQACHRAKPFIEARWLLEEVEKRSKVTTPEGESTTLVEVYLDESGGAGNSDGVMRHVGALVVGFHDSDGPKALSDYFRTNGCKFGWDATDPRSEFENDSQANGKEYWRSPDGVAKLRECLASAASGGLVTFWKTIRVSRTDGEVQSDTPDSPYRDLLEPTIEVALSELVPSLVSGGVDVRIAAARRTVVVAASWTKEQRAPVANWCREFGLQVIPSSPREIWNWTPPNDDDCRDVEWWSDPDFVNASDRIQSKPRYRTDLGRSPGPPVGWAAHTADFDGLFWHVRATRQRHPSSQTRVVGARAVSFQYLDKPQKAYWSDACWQQHYVADVICLDWKEWDLDLVLDDGLRSVVRAGRAVSVRDWVDAARNLRASKVDFRATGGLAALADLVATRLWRVIRQGYADNPSKWRTEFALLAHALAVDDAGKPGE